MPTPNIKDRAAYDALPSLNYSAIKQLLLSPAHYQRYLAEPREETKALRQGIMSHAAALEPDKFIGTYVVAPKCDKRTKEGKAAAETFAASLQPGQIAADPEEWQLSVNLAQSFQTLVAAVGCKKFEATEFMISVEYNGVPMKCAIDAIGDGYIYDFKTTGDDASPRQFLRTALSYKYNLQGVIYRTLYEAYTGERLKGFRVVPVEKDTLFGAVYEFGPEMQTRGLFDFEEALKLYKECTASGIWPGYSADPTVATVIDLDARPSLSTPINFA